MRGTRRWGQVGSIATRNFGLSIIIVWGWVLSWMGEVYDSFYLTIIISYMKEEKKK